MSSRAYRNAPTDSTTFYPRLIGTHGAVAGNSYLSVNAAVDVLKAGGNAIDAAVAACFVEGLVNPQMHTLGGECPMLVRLAGENRVIAVNGNMAAPARATPDAYRSRGLAESGGAWVGRGRVVCASPLRKTGAHFSGSCSKLAAQCSGSTGATCRSP